MARAFWKGSLSFGLVEIPVSLRPAEDSTELSFTLLDRNDFSPVGYKRYNKNTGREVPWDRVIRGYEYEPGEYVVLTDEELKRANVKATQTIEISEFVDGREIDPAYYETPYYVEPLKKGSKSYALLREALERSGRVGIAQIVLRTRQRLAALTVRDGALLLDLLRYPHELRQVDSEAIPKRGAGVTQREIEMAERLIGEMAAPWKPSEFHDTYQEDVLELVRRKVKSGQTHAVVEPEKTRGERAPRTDVVDLMPLLKKSLEERGASAAKKGKTRLSRRKAGAATQRAPARRAPARSRNAAHGRSRTA
jgi:DNA end-binding protein Ku